MSTHQCSAFTGHDLGPSPPKGLSCQAHFRRYLLFLSVFDSSVARGTSVVLMTYYRQGSVLGSEQAATIRGPETGEMEFHSHVSPLDMKLGAAQDSHDLK